MLRIQDRSASTSGSAAGRHVFEDSAEINDILHGVGCEKRCWKRHTEWLEDSAAPGFTKYWIEWKDRPENYLGMGVKIPLHLPELLRRALLMQNLCEWAVVILHSAVEAIVKQSMLGTSRLHYGVHTNHHSRS